MSLKIIISNSNDPYENLALEDLVLRSERYAKSGDDYLILYINRPCLVLGNFQCLWKEIPWQAREKYSLEIVRRQSGGGTVYHDLGNLNFSFVFDKDKYPKNGQSPKLVKFFDSLGIQVESSGRDDFGVKDKETGLFYKFSGQAFKQTRDRTLHHGTLLFNSDLEVLKELCVPNKNVVSKSVDSVVSKVTNLIETLPEDLKINETREFFNSLVDYFVEKYSAEILKIDKHDDLEAIKEKVDQLKSWEVVYGKTPNFQFPFTLEGEEVIFDIKKAVVHEVRVTKTNLDQSFYDGMIGLRLNKSDLERYVSQIQNTNYDFDVNFIAALKTRLFLS